VQQCLEVRSGLMGRVRTVVLDQKACGRECLRSAFTTNEERRRKCPREK
jgi:hypothetical protein